ncbi:DUF803-domain-containing protein [Auriculariales sp. MPI-PUGE-AT-0066]|nr:DUF803-domain-containing protein [Auriculariales sp. MPI-PUGE-AT-0066]
MAETDASNPSAYRAVGICLAIGSGLLIGASFPIKKIGLKSSQKEAGEGVAYLSSPLWWTGMIMMILGELCNFGAYAFVEAMLVTPLGALSVCISAMLSHFFLKEKLTLFGWIGCCQCILGSVIIALNGPEEQSVTTIKEVKHLFLAPGFLHGTTNMLWYIAVCSLIGGLSVSCTQGLGACIVTSIRGQNQFKNWFIYFLLAFVACTLLTEIFYLNKALALFNTAMVTPTYYVLFTFCTLVTSVILYQGLKASVTQILTIVLGFFVICTGIFVLQMSRVDPRRLRGVDRRTSMLLLAAREDVAPAAMPERHGLMDEEKAHGTDADVVITASEDPGMDALRGTFGAVGTLVRARRRLTSLRRAGSNATVDGRTAAHIRDQLRAEGAVGPGRGSGGGPPSVFASSQSSIHQHGADDEEPTMSRLLAAEGTR